MALLRNAPWNWAQLIVDKDGKATPEFLAWLQQQLTIAQVAGAAVPSSRLINTGTGLAGGGDLSADRTLVLDAVIDDLNDVDTVTNPPVDGQALVWDNIAGDWVPGDVATSLIVEEEGTPVLSDVDTINFIGDNVTVTTPSAGQVDVTIDVPPSLIVEEEGTPVLSDVDTINFIGADVTVTTPSAGQVDVTISVPTPPDPAIYGPVSNGTTPGPVLLDNGAGECILAEVP